MEKYHWFLGFKLSHVVGLILWIGLWIASAVLWKAAAAAQGQPAWRWGIERFRTLNKLSQIGFAVAVGAGIGMIALQPELLKLGPPADPRPLWLHMKVSIAACLVVTEALQARAVHWKLSAALENPIAGTPIGRPDQGLLDALAHAELIHRIRGGVLHITLPALLILAVFRPF